MKIEERKMEVTVQQIRFEDEEEVPVFGLCAFNRKRLCSYDCTALAIMAIPRSRLVKDAQLGTHTVVFDREPVVGPFCKRGGFPIGIHADEQTIAKEKKSSPDVSVG